MTRFALRAVNAVIARFGVRLETGAQNDGMYWDRYVRRWESENSGIVGSEWKGEDIFLSLLRKHATGVALEIGAGGGRITAQAASLVSHVHACDVSKEMLRANRECVTAGNVTHHLLDGFTLEAFADESIDFVFSHDVFVHFSSLQVYPYLAEVRRVLKNGGTAMVSFYNLPKHFGLFKEMSAGFARQRVFPPHMRVHFMTEEILRLMLDDLGFRIIDVDSTNFLIAVFRK